MQFSVDNMLGQKVGVQPAVAAGYVRGC